MKIVPPPPATVEKWTPAQRAAENLKNTQRAEAAARGELEVTPVRGSSSLRSIWTAENGPVPSGHQIDHIIDRQLGGSEASTNAQPLDGSGNMSNGVRTAAALKGPPPGTRITTVTFTLLSVTPYVDAAVRIYGFSREFEQKYGRDPSFRETLRFLATGDRRSDQDVLFEKPST
jgi:hypothetical protein